MILSTTGKAKTKEMRDEYTKPLRLEAWQKAWKCEQISRIGKICKWNGSTKLKQNKQDINQRTEKSKLVHKVNVKWTMKI